MSQNGQCEKMQECTKWLGAQNTKMHKMHKWENMHKMPDGFGFQSLNKFQNSQNSMFYQKIFTKCPKF